MFRQRKQLVFKHVIYEVKNNDKQISNKNFNVDVLFTVKCFLDVNLYITKIIKNNRIFVKKNNLFSYLENDTELTKETSISQLL